MKQELKDAISTAATGVRAAKDKLETAQRAVKRNEELIERFQKEQEAAEDKMADLHADVIHAGAELKAAGDRYSFYCNEAINHPYA